MDCKKFCCYWCTLWIYVFVTLSYPFAYLSNTGEWLLNFTHCIHHVMWRRMFTFIPFSWGKGLWYPLSGRRREFPSSLYTARNRAILAPVWHRTPVIQLLSNHHIGLSWHCNLSLKNSVILRRNQHIFFRNVGTKHAVPKSRFFFYFVEILEQAQILGYCHWSRNIGLEISVSCNSLGII